MLDKKKTGMKISASNNELSYLKGHSSNGSISVTASDLWHHL